MTKLEFEQMMAKYKPDWHWLGRSLKNYKEIHTPTARSKGCLERFLAAPTLTQARKILFGHKKRNSK